MGESPPEGLVYSAAHICPYLVACHPRNPSKGTPVWYYSLWSPDPHLGIRGGEVIRMTSLQSPIPWLI